MEGETVMNELAERAWNSVCHIARWAVWLGGTMLFVAAAIVTAEVALRKMIPSTLETLSWVFRSIGLTPLANGTDSLNGAMHSLVFSGSDEISGYLFAVGTSWSMAHVLVTRGHIRIDALYGQLPLKVRGWLDLVALVTLGIFVAAMVQRSFDVTLTNFVEHTRSNTNLRIPLAWAQIPWFLGFLLFAFALVLAFLRTLLALLKGDYAAAAAISGVATQDEEIENELKGLGIERPRQ